MMLLMPSPSRFVIIMYINLRIWWGEKYDSQFANYRELYPYSVLDKKDQKNVDSIMKEYSKYIEGLEKNLGKDLEGRSK